MKNALAVSVKILKSKCQLLLGPSTVIMTVGENLIWPLKEPVNVVFMGPSLNLITQKYLWPPDLKIRLWTLSISHKTLLTKLLGLKENEVGVLPRYKLFSLKKEKKEKNFFLRETTLVYSGRIFEEKNFGLVVKVAHELQQRCHEKVNFLICGPQPEARSSADIHREINKYDWKIAPLISFNLGSVWTKKIKKKNPVLLNLSTFLQEDFGVSVAEAQEAGWPVILSEWGGHLDVRGPNVIKIPSKLILKKDVKSIVDRALRGPVNTNAKKLNSKFANPKTITYKDVEERIKLVSKKRIVFYQTLYADDLLKPELAAKKMFREIVSILSKE